MDREMKVMRRLLILTALTLAMCCGAYGMNIADAKQLPDYSPVALNGKVVTYASTDFFYIQEGLQYAGIRVEKPGHGLSAGVLAYVNNGTITTNANGERIVSQC